MSKDFRYLQNLTDQELDRLLDQLTFGPSNIKIKGKQQKELQQDDDIDLIIAIMEEFDRRKPEPEEDPDDILEALERLKRKIQIDLIEDINPLDGAVDPFVGLDAPNVLGSNGTKKSLIQKKHRPIFAVAACVLLVLVISGAFSATASADGHRFWDKIIGFSKETFGLGDEIESKVSTVPQAVVDPIFDELQAELTANGIKIKLPTWVPEGYSFKVIDKDAGGLTVRIQAHFVSENKEFVIFVTSKGDGSDIRSALEENASKGNHYEFANVEHYITVNTNKDNGETRASAIWYDGDVMVELQGSLTEEETKHMIDSIYEGVMQ